MTSLIGSTFVSILEVYQNVMYEHHHKFVQMESENLVYRINKGHGGVG